MDSTISRFPLAWPAGRPRTPAYRRHESKFGTKRDGKWGRDRLTVSAALGRVMDELKRLGVDENDVVISTSVPTRLDGLPRSGAGEPADPGVAVYWVRKGRTNCMAIDRYDRVADNLAALAATLEALRAIERHGGGEIMEQAFNGFQLLPAPPQWWQELEFEERPTDIRVVEKRYRELASKYHPDRHPDGHWKMPSINAARDRANEELQ